MNEKTTIGGTVYETIGSSNSNLLLKCNGTARILWGNKLIDLIKNGKIASESNSDQIFIVSNKSDIKSDGLYILNENESQQLWVCKNGNQYNFTEDNLYISAINELNITVELQQQALKNIGMYYNTLEDVKNAGIQNGLVYVLNDKSLYTIQDGVISDFEAKLKTITVEQNQEEEEQGEVINSSVKIVLSISENEYLILSDRKIIVNLSIYIKNYSQICSENADVNKGFRIYMEDEKSCLDIDKINVRDVSNGIMFSRGMIIMHSGITDIPEGWAICDGKSYTYNGITSITPDLTNKFIKAVTNIEDVKSVTNPDLNENNEFVLQSLHLPQHTHPHQPHTHSFEGTGELSSELTIVDKIDEKEAIVSIENGTVGYSGDDVYEKTLSPEISISGNVLETISIEQDKVWENKSFKIEPNYYSLIFIMKL